MTAAGLRWLVGGAPAIWWGLDWMRDDLRAIASDRGLDALTRATGIDLRTTGEVALAGYPQQAVAYLVRHARDPRVVEARFRERLTHRPVRRVAGHQRVSVFGRVGNERRGLATIGPDVAVFQFGGERRTGPARIAVRYSLGELTDIPRAREDPALASLARAFDGAPGRAFWPGPFDGDVAGGLRGLLSVSTGVGLRAMPRAPDAIDITLLVLGDYQENPDRAAALLARAWDDVTTADLGSLLSLEAPIREPTTFPLPGALGLHVTLSASRLLRGLRIVTAASIRDALR